MDADALPPRPYIPPTAAMACGVLFAGGIVLDGAWRLYADTGGVAIPYGRALCLAAAGTALLLLAAFARARGERGGGKRAVPRFRRYLLMLGIGLLVGVAAGCRWTGAYRTRMEAVLAFPASSYALRTQGDPSISAYGASSTVSLYRVSDGAYAGEARMTCDEAYEAGLELRIIGRLERLDTGDWARSRFMKGEAASLDVVKVTSCARRGAFDPIGGFRAAALSAIEPDASDARALLAGIVCGRTTELNGCAASDDFSRTGLTHLVAVSGSHLAFIGALLQGLFERLRFPRGFRSAVTVCIMSAYIVFTGCAPSAVRSVLMVACGTGAALGKRRPHPISGLALTVILLASLDPGIAFDLGFQLSAMSVLFILVFSRYGAAMLQRAGLPGAVAEPLALTLFAQWATLPLTLPVFGQLSLVAPLANLLAGPVMSALLVVGLIAVPIGALLPPLCASALAIPEMLANASVFLAQALAGIPFASVPIAADARAAVLYIPAALLYFAWRDWKRWQLLCSFALLAALGAWPIIRWTLFAPASVTVLDVGQADSILVRDGSHAVLVDAGVDDEVVAALARNNVYRLDAVVVTHWDSDHWGGLPDILGNLAVDRLLVAEGAASSMPAALEACGPPAVEELSCGDTLHVGAFSCTVVWPQGPVTGEENADSLCLDVSYRDGDGTLDMLLTGDTECDQEHAYAEDVGDIDVLKLGHHGSKVSVDGKLMDVLDPELSIASAGEGNSYGHPTEECIETVEAHGSRFACTIDAGDITVRPGEQGARVSAEHAEALQ